FGLGQPAAIPKVGNTGDGSLTAEFTDASAIHATSYDIVYNGTQYVVTRQSDGAVQTLTPSADTPPTIEFDGMTVTLDGTPAAGDLKALITDPAKLALADAAGGTTNGANGLLLAKLQTEKVLGGGTLSLSGQFSQLINNIGVQTQQIKTAATAQDNLITQQTSAYLSVSGVNLNEEYVNLTIYQEQYQASAKILDVASTVFDTLLGLR